MCPHEKANGDDCACGDLSCGGDTAGQCVGGNAKQLGIHQHSQRGQLSVGIPSVEHGTRRDLSDDGGQQRSGGYCARRRVAGRKHWSGGEKAIYTANNAESASFTVLVPETGAYVLTVSGRQAEGSVKFTLLAGTEI